MTTEHHLQLPVGDDQVRQLKLGDVVYVSGVIYTMRDMGHRRAVDMVRRGDPLPFDLNNGTIWHCGPITQQGPEGKWHVLSAGPTTSSRFNELGPEVMQVFGVRCVIGKGSMGTKAIETIRQSGGVFLNATGGCGALYAGQVEEVLNVFWQDLGMPEAIWMVRANCLGPLIVGIDHHGNCLMDNVRQEMRARLESIYKQSGISGADDLSYLPKRVAAKASVRKNEGDSH